MWESVSKGILKTLSGKPCQKQYQVYNIGRLRNLAGTFLWKPLLGDLYLGTFWSIIPRCSPFSPSSSSLRCTQVKSNPTVTKLPPGTPCQKQYLKPWEQRRNFHLESTWDCLVNLCLGTLGGMGFGAAPACNFGNLQDFVGTFIWKPEYLYLGTFAWGPLLGNFCLATSICKPLPGTLGTL